MPDFERRVTVALDAETAFDRLAEPERLPLWLVGIALDEAIAVDGDPSLQDQGEARPVAPPARFLADRADHRIEWAAPSGAYSGELKVESMLAGMSAVVVRLHTRDAVDETAAGQAFDTAMRNLQRQLTG